MYQWKSLELKKSSFALNACVNMVCHGSGLTLVLLSYTESIRFLVGLELMLLGFRRFLRLLLIFRDLDESEWFM